MGRRRLAPAWGSCMATPPGFAGYRGRTPLRPDPKSGSGDVWCATKRSVHIADVTASTAYAEQRVPELVAAAELGGSRTVLAVPMLKEDELIGAILMSRQEVRPFSDKQIALVTNSLPKPLSRSRTRGC